MISNGLTVMANNGGDLLWPRNFIEANNIVTKTPGTTSLNTGTNNDIHGNSNLVSGSSNYISGNNNFSSGSSNVINGADNTILVGDRNFIGSPTDLENPPFIDNDGSVPGETPAGSNSTIFGFKNKVSGVSTVVLNELNTAIGDKIFINGFNCAACADGSHAEGTETWAGGLYKAQEIYLGRDITSPDDAPVFIKPYDLIEKYYDTVTAEGFSGQAQYSHAEGHGTITRSQYSHAEGEYTVTSTSVYGQHVEGKYNLPIDKSPFNQDALLVIGIGDSETDRRNGLVFDKGGNLFVSGKLRIGNNEINAGNGLIPYGNNGTHTGKFSVNLGSSTNASAKDSLAIGEYTIASGIQSFAGGKNNTHAFGETAFAFGTSCKAYKNSCAIGKSNIAGKEGDDSITGATAFGESCKAYGKSSFSANRDNESKNENSTTFGQHNIANRDNQFVCGYRNKEDSNAMFIVGNGNSNTRANIFTVHQQGAFQIPVFKYDNKTGKYTKTTTNKYIILLEENDMTTFKIIDDLNNLQ